MLKINKKHELWCDLCGTMIVQGTGQACDLAHHYTVSIVEHSSRAKVEKCTDIEGNPIKDCDGKQVTRTVLVPAKKNKGTFHLCLRCGRALEGDIEERTKLLTKPPKPNRWL